MRNLALVVWIAGTGGYAVAAVGEDRAAAWLAAPRAELARLTPAVRGRVASAGERETCPCTCHMALLTCLETDRDCPLRPDHARRIAEIAGALQSGREPPAVLAGPSVEAIQRDRAIGVAEARRLFDRGEAVFLDARLPDAYRKGHIRGAVNLPVRDFEAGYPPLKSRLEKAKTVITYCPRHCVMSAVLARKLLGLGLGNVRVLDGGWDDWRHLGHPVTTP